MAYDRFGPPLLGVPVPGSGSPTAIFMFIMDRPSRNDPKAGKLYADILGVEFNRYLRLARLDRPDVYLTALVKEYGDWDITQAELDKYSVDLLQEIEDVNPTFLVPMGREATRFILGDVDMERVHGLLHDGGHFGFDGRFVFPVYAPGGGLHSGDNVPQLHYDFTRLANPFDHALPDDAFPDAETCYRNHHPALDAQWWEAPLVGLDSEGYAQDAWSAQYSTAPGTGRYVPARGGVEWARDNGKFWSRGGRYLIHSSLHDLQVLPAMGLHIRDGGFIDTMVLSYILTDLPQGLKSLAYRIAGLKMNDYQDVIAPAKPVVEGEWLQAALAVAPDIAAPEAELLWDDKKENWRMKQPQTIAQRLKRIVRDLEKGKDVDIAKRVSGWEDSAAEELLDLTGGIPSPTLLDIPRAQAQVYATRDADATLRIAPYLIARVKDEGLQRVADIDHSIIPMVNMMQEKGILINAAHFNQMDADLTRQMSDKRDEIADMVGVRINPSSSDQVAALLFKQLGLPPRKWTKGGDESTQAKVLEGMRHDHPVIPLLLEYRHYDKIRGSFARKLPRLAGADGRVRGNIRVTRTASGRIAMNTPNLMAIPVRTKLGRQLREGFVARPGCVIGNWDLDQIEMREIADLSRDPLLLELFRDPSRDIHAETAARMFDKPIADIDPKTERYAAKRVGFGIATQITGAGLVDQMELAGARHSDGSKWTEDECNHLISLWFGVYPGVRRLIDRCKADVRRTGYGICRWGRIRPLHGVYSSVKRIQEEALRQGPSHKIQAGAQGVMKQIMAAIWRRLKEEGLLDEVWPILQIHDSIMLEVPEYLFDLVNEIVIECMEETVAEHYCIPITASGEKGENWGEMEDADVA